MEKKETKVNEAVENQETELQENTVETTATTVEAKPVIPVKTRVANFVYNHRTAIVGIVAGVVGAIGGLVVGGKTGFAAGVNSVKAETPAQIPTTDVPEVEIPMVETTDVNV